MKKRSTWQQKLDKVQEWKVVEAASGTKLIPTPRQIEALVNQIPAGAVSTAKLMRQELARRFGADTTCPLCTGMFLRIAAEAADEQRQLGQAEITPYWRVVDQKGRHNPKLPGGAEGQAALLDADLHRAMGTESLVA